MDNYEVLGQIGKGSFGLVQKIKRKQDGKILVWKEMNYGKMSEREKQQLVAEVNIIRELKHPNIVRYYDRIIEKKDTKIFIIMEYCEGGDMGTLLKKCKREKDYIAEDVIWKIFTQVVLALNECHNRTQGKILHRDLKPANIFLDSQNNIKLGDFGLSRVMGENSEFARTHVGTPYYMSPEQIQESKYNEKSDIWSAGCLLYEMAALKPPFEATNHLTLAIKIKSGKFERLPIRYSEELQKLVESMLNTDPEKRPSVQNLIELQQINLRLKERKLREKHSQIKQKEDELKKRDEQLQERISQVEKKENEMLQQIQMIKDLEESLKQLENQAINIIKSSTISYSTEEQIKMNNQMIQQQQPQKSARGDYQLLSQNLNNFGKDLLLLNKQSIENTNSSNSESKNSTIASSNNTFEMYKKEKENMINQLNNLNNNQTNNTNNITNLENYKKEKEIQRQLQAYSTVSSNPTTTNNNQSIKNLNLFKKSNNSIISQSLTDKQLQLQQQNSIESYVTQQENNVISSESSNSNEGNNQNEQQQSSSSQQQKQSQQSQQQDQNNKEKNYTLYMRREQEIFQKTPQSAHNHHQNHHQRSLNHQESTDVESVTKKNNNNTINNNGSYVKDHEYRSVDHFTHQYNNLNNNNNNNNINNNNNNNIINNNSSSKKDESTAFSTTCKVIPSSASHSSNHQNLINQNSSNKSSHKSSCENLPIKKNNNININQTQSSNIIINQFNTNTTETITNGNISQENNQNIVNNGNNNIINNGNNNNNTINNTGMSAFEKYKQSVQAGQQIAQNNINNTYSSKYAQLKSKGRVVSTDSCEELQQNIRNHHINNNNTLNNINQQNNNYPTMQIKSRVQTSIDSTSSRINNNNYIKREQQLPLSNANATGVNHTTSQNISSNSIITRRSAVIESNKSIDKNNSNVASNAHDLYKQVNMRRTDTYKDNNTIKHNSLNRFKSDQQQNQTSATTFANNNNNNNSNTNIINKYGSSNSVEPKNRLHSYHSHQNSNSGNIQQQQQQPNIIQTMNKPPTSLNGISQPSSTTNEDIQKYNFKTLPNAEYASENNTGRINTITSSNVHSSSSISQISQIKKKNNNSFSTVSTTNTNNNNNHQYLNTNNSYTSNINGINNNSSGNNTARNKGDNASNERKKDFPIRPRNNYILPSSSNTSKQQQQQQQQQQQFNGITNNNNNDMNTRNYLSEQQNSMNIQTEQLYNKYVSGNGNRNIVSPNSAAQYVSNQYRSATQY